MNEREGYRGMPYTDINSSQPSSLPKHVYFAEAFALSNSLRFVGIFKDMKNSQY